MSPLDQRRQVVLERVLAIVAGAAPVSEIGRFMSADVVVHMDGLAFAGLGAWTKWIRYQHARGEVVDVELEIVSLAREGTLWRVGMRARGRARSSGAPRRSQPVEIRYRWAGERIVEAWTRRRNYEFFFGPGLRSPLGFAALLARIVAWNHRHPLPESEPESPR